MVLGSTKPLIEMSTTNISLGGKGGGCVGLALPSSWAEYLDREAESSEVKSPKWSEKLSNAEGSEVK
jgi:hypothetical protein